MEVFIQKAATVVLVHDSKLTGVVFCISLAVYYITSFIPTKVFFGLFVVGLFSIPYYYDQHQEKVDGYLLQLQQKSQSTVDKYSTIVKRRSSSVYEQALVVRDTVQHQIKSVSRRMSSTTPAMDDSCQSKEMSE
jgi:hypothetical protein